MIVGQLPTELVPGWAAQWLADGLDGDALRQLAGLRGDDPHDVRDLLPAALLDAGVTLPEWGAGAEREAFRSASIQMIYRSIAESFERGLVGPQWVVQKVYEVVSNNNYDDVSTDGPMGWLWQIDDEWDQGWGRGNDKLTQEIEAACRAQLLL